MTIPESDEDLVVRFVDNGDGDAFRALMERYVEKVRRMAASILGARQALDIDDVVQEIFLRIHRGLSKFRGDAKVGTWIFRIAKNQSLTHRQRFARSREVTTDDPLPELISQACNPADKLDKEHLRRAVDLAIEQLPQEYQTVVRLYYWFEVPVAEIADQLGTPQNTIKSWLYRARKLLAHLLDEARHDHGD